MNVLMISSSSANIDKHYLETARDISDYLAENDYNLVFGASSSSMMGECYKSFIERGRDVLSFTTNKYTTDIANLSASKIYVRETTFDLKKSMFENSDLVVVLPGGIGTLSELLSFVEEKRSNDKNIPIELYNDNGFFNPMFDMLDLMTSTGFINFNIKDYINISENMEEFVKNINEIQEKKEEYNYGK